jgi:putative nucleotidyltransferase with HDIG domain
VLGLSVSRLWSKVRAPAGWSMAQFNRHSVASAILADLLAVETRVEYAEGAFTAGLLHDVGKLLIAITFPAEFVEIDRAAGGDWRQEEVCEETILGLRHAELSAAALTRWNLPAPITEAVKHHHAQLNGAPLGLAGVVQVADVAANEMGHGCRAAIPASGDPAATLTGHVREGRSEKLLAEFERSFQAIQTLF